MLPNQIMRIALYGVGITSIASIIWLAGPLIVIGDWRPLESYIVREILILLLLTGAASFGGFKFYRRKKSAEAIAKGISEEGKDESDAVVLKDKMKDAIATLRTASGSRSKKGDFLYDLPWYVIIGPPGSGKTTALVNSGLKFPLSRGGTTPAAVAGVGGTRYCDWWFTEDAVLIDTAGRYTTQDSDAKADKKSWLAFLDVLKRNRPRQPINGVIVAISLEDLLRLSSADINGHAMAIRARLLELHDRLKVDFPVYALFTKGDLVAGFMEYFGYLSEQGRRQVWGATFQTADKRLNLVSEVPVEFDALIERLNAELTDRLQDEPVPNTRVSLFGFPAQMAALKRPIFDFLNQIFEPTRYHANANLRGFYFTSGTQQGTPIDQLISALVKSFGAEEIAGSAYSGLGKSFFLNSLITKVIIGEAAWVSTDRAAVRRARIIKAAMYSVLCAVFASATIAWWTSYGRNRDLIARTDNAAADYAKAAGPLARATLIADRDFSQVLPLLHRLRFMPAGYAARSTPVPLAATFGLSQRDRLQSASENVYHVALERLFRSRLVFRMEEQLEANKTNPSFVYEALKVYQMLGARVPLDRDLVIGWVRRDWEDNLYPGAGNANGRKALEEHLLAMLDLDAGEEPLIELDGNLIRESQRILARLSVSQRAYELIKSQVRQAVAPDWVAARRGGADFALVFEAARGENIESIRVPGFFTYAGFHRTFLAAIGGIAEQVNKEQWVLGEAGEQSAFKAQYDTLGPDLLELYTRDFIAAWRQAIGKLELRRLTGDKPKYTALGAISAAASPLKQLLESIRDETALTRERPGFNQPAPGGTPAPAGAPAAAPGNNVPALLKQQDRAPGASIEAAFKQFHVMVEGDATRRPIDEIVANLKEINNSLIMLNTNPSQAPVANAQLQTQVAGLRANANRLPAPFSDMLLKAAGSFEGDLTTSTVAQLARALGDQVSGACQQIISGRYPFVRSSDREVPLQDFGRLFGTGGIMDSFFTQNLKPLVDTSKREWTWRQDNVLARTLSVATLREFQRAAQIRDAFFGSGGTIPSINLTVFPPVLPSPGITAKLEINGIPVNSQPNVSTPTPVQWPGGGLNRTAVTVGSDTPGQQPSVLERQGVWSLFRMLDSASISHRGDRTVAHVIVGGRDLQYQFSAGSVLNPLSLPALREFRCPSGI